MTMVQRFIEGTTFKLTAKDGVERLCRIANSQNNILQLEDLLFNQDMKVRLEDLEVALSEGRIEFEKNATDSPPEQPFSEDLAALPKNHQEEVLRRYKYITKLKEQSVTSWTENSLSQRIPNIAADMGDLSPPNWRTVARWHQAYLSKGPSIKSLFTDKMNMGNTNNRLFDDVESYIKEAIATYKTKERISIRAAWDNLDSLVTKANKSREDGDKLPLPTYETLRQRIKAESPYEIMRAREGRRKADIEFASIGISLKLERVMQRVEVDHTKLDIFLVDDENYMPLGRPWLTTSIDALSRSITGFYIGFHPPSFVSLIKLLHIIINSKGWIKEKYPNIKNDWVCSGVPEVFVFDNGKEFWSKDLEIILAELNVQTQYNPVQKPWLKGKIERLYGTINKKLLIDIPGKTFSNILERGDYDPEKHAVMTFSTFVEILYTWVIDVYQQQPAVKNSLIPDLAWRENLKDFPPRHVDPKRLDIILGRTKHSKLRRGGIQYSNLRYDSDELASLRGQIGSIEVMYKVDPDNLGSIHAFNEVKREYLKVSAVDQEYAAGLTEWQHKVNRRYARKHIRKHYNHDDVVAARDAIQALVKTEIERWESGGKKGKTGTNTKLARYGKVADKSTGTVKTVADFPSKPSSYVQDTTLDTKSDVWAVPTDRTGWSTSGDEEQ